MKKSIQSRIMFYSGALLLSVLICQIIFSVFLFRSYYTNLKKSEVEKLFYELKENYSDDPDTISSIIQKAQDAYNINVHITDGKKVIYGRGLNVVSRVLSGRGLEMIYSLEPKATISSISERANISQWAQARLGSIVLMGKFKYNGGWRYVRITSPIEAIDASVAAFTKVNAVISVLILIIGVAGSLIFARRISRPIREIEEVARNVALLNFDVHADENTSTSELGSLSKSINAMSDKLKSLITDLQASNAKLKEDVDAQKRLDRMRRDFVANVSHELKSPLHLLMMYCENLKHNINNIDKDYYCDTIIEEVNRMNDMVMSLLDLSALENGLSRIKTERVDLSGLVDSVTTKLSVLFDGLSERVSIESGVCIDGDSHYLEQAIKNYVTNAVSHTPVGGRISISLRRQGDKALFTVFNEGEHIRREDMEHIWESFYKTDKARVRTEEKHSGLGLYIVKTIISAHNGEYGARNVDNGVEFWFSLPVLK
ncbi:MAG: HAMP domain-containing protein [Clostridiaceae bacterium]|nr:HAMP domain-containing protein [Clostridiaceae bacterium]